jgi:hypothetical protein
MNRFILKIIFLSDKSLRLKVIFVDKRFLTEDSRIRFHNHENFYICSRKTLKITDRSLRFPTKELFEVDENKTCEYEFSNEKAMYTWLKRLKKTLLHCNDEFHLFVNSPDYGDRNSRLIMSGDYWLL